MHRIICNCIKGNIYLRTSLTQQRDTTPLLTCNWRYTMSNTIAYSASFVGLLLAIGDPELSNKKMTLTSAVSTDNDDSFALHLSYYPGIEPRAVQDEDIVLASGSLRVVFSNGIMTLFSDATSLNVVVDAEHVSKGVVNPASNTTCVISTTGMCLRTEPGDRGFVMETGAWNTEVRTFLDPSLHCQAFTNTIS